MSIGLYFLTEHSNTSTHPVIRSSMTTEARWRLLALQCHGTQARRGRTARERSKVPRLRRNRLRLVLGNRSQLQIYVVDRECVWFRRGEPDRHDLLGSRSLETEPEKWR